MVLSYASILKSCVSSLNVTVYVKDIGLNAKGIAITGVAMYDSENIEIGINTYSIDESLRIS